MMNTAVSSTIETDASIYSVTVTTDATVSTQINIAAQSPEQANQKALELVKTCGAIWALDEDSIHQKDAYLPDPESTEPLNVSSSNQSSPQQGSTRQFLSSSTLSIPKAIKLTPTKSICARPQCLTSLITQLSLPL